MLDYRQQILWNKSIIFVLIFNEAMLTEIHYLWLNFVLFSLHLKAMNKDERSLLIKNYNLFLFKIIFIIGR